MIDFSREIRAYALQNAIEFGSADVSKILPKLFQHGLKKEDIKTVMVDVQKIVREVNKLSAKECVDAFEILKDVVKKHEEKARVLPELPEVKKKMVFRMAPFPSGALHIGNAKTALLNALYAEKYDGEILLVIDDTIGSEEKQPIKEAYGLIEEACQLLGINYKKPIIYKSDRLHIYYDYAKEMIEKGKAYVCHCVQNVLRDNRAKGIECGCRQFPVKMQLERWKDMFNAKEGAAALRIKTDMQHPNPAFRDRVLFRISDREHPRVGKKYRVWPTLEMTWGVDDHLLGITHIIRGNELMIETDMEKYMWDIFKWKHPVTIHTGLIKIEGMGAKISKSKNQKEIREGTFTGWDDPRTWSIQSLIKRGITKESIREFVKEIGLNRQDITVPIESLYAANRRIIDAVTARYSFVEQPHEFLIANDKLPKNVKVALHPDIPDKTREIAIDNAIYISEQDFQSHNGKEVRLIHLCNIKLGDKPHITSFDNVAKIPKIQWVGKHVPAKILMPDGTWKEGIADADVETLVLGAVVQFERVGFVCFHGVVDGKAIFWFAHR